MPSKKLVSTDSNDGRKRNRLSKPPTNTSSLNLSSLSLLQSGTRNSTLFPLRTSAEELREQSPSVSNDGQGESPNACVLEPDSEDLQAPPQLDAKSWRGTAFVVTEVAERDSFSPSPRSPITSPLSGIFNTSCLSLLPSRDQKDIKERTSSRTDIPSENASREDLAAPIPIRRKSLRQPGIATRVKRDERWGPSPRDEGEVDADRDYYYNPLFPQETSWSELEALNLETARFLKPIPPPLVRTETPSDLVFLGGLKLGTLHVTNGRASPAPSDLSRRAKARSTPNLRTASSEYGDSDQGDCDSNKHTVYLPGSSKGADMPEVPLRSVPQAPRFQSPLRLTSNESLPRINTTCEYPDRRLGFDERGKNTYVPEKSPDRSVCMAEEYKAEFPASPFAITRRNSTSRSNLQTTTKSTEFDDGLFEDASVTPSDSDSVDMSSENTFYSSADVNPAQETQEPSNKNVRPGYILADSGYSSNSPTRDEREVVHKTATANTTKSTNALYAVTNTPENALIIQNREDRKPGPRPPRPSILKQGSPTTTSLPIFKNLHQSTTTISTIMTTTSMPPAHKAKKLTKLRVFSGSPRSKEIAVQGNHEISTSSIPPIPVEFAANLAIRSQQVPELEHTFETRQHTADSPTLSYFQSLEIRFPSPTASNHGSDDESSSPPRPPAHKQSTFRRRSKSEKRGRSERRLNAQHSTNDMSEADALAIIQDFGTVGHALGGNPYDIARTNPQSSSRGNAEPAGGLIPHTATCATKRPKPLGGMDAETAAELARRRSRSIRERDSMGLAEKRNIFNDRGGLPGKNLRPMSFANHTPPLPSLPTDFGTNQRQSWTLQTTGSQIQQGYSWRPGYCRSEYYNEELQPPHDRSHYNHWNVSTPSHEGNNEHVLEGYPTDTYGLAGSRRQSWRSDCVEIDFDPRAYWRETNEQSQFSRRSEDRPRDEYEESRPYRQTAPYSSHTWNENEVDEDAPPPPPPPHSPRPMSVQHNEEQGNTWAAHSQAWQARRQSAGEALRHTSDSQHYGEFGNLYPEIPVRNTHSNQNYHETYMDSSNIYHEYAHDEDSSPYYPSQSSRQHSSRRHSRPNSDNGSYAGSFAENSQPPDDPAQISPSPQFGRFSGGFGYGYEHGYGFGGSAGTRSVSGLAGASRKGKELSEGYGIDLSDVPIIAGLKKL